MIISQILTVAANSAPWWSFLSKFWNSLPALQWAAVISAAFLTVGAIIEYWKQLKVLVQLIGKWVFRRLSPFESCALRKLLIHALAPILVVLGIAGDFVFEGRAFILEDRQEEQSQQKIGQLGLEASANEVKADQLQKDAAGLHEQAEAEHLARVKLEAEIEPRRLTIGQQQAVAENCSKFKNLFEGKRVKLLSYSLDTEAFVLAEQVVTALRMKPCEMTVDDDAMSITPGMGMLVMGIQVFGPDSELAKNIAEAIGSSGKPVAVSFVASDPTAGAQRIETPNSLLPHAATVLVGLKMPDADTIKELNRITPAAKPLKP